MAQLFNINLIGGLTPTPIPFSLKTAFIKIKNKSKHPVDLYLKLDGVSYNPEVYQIAPDELFEQRIFTDEIKLFCKKNARLQIMSLSSSEFFGEIEIEQIINLDNNAVSSNYKCVGVNNGGQPRLTFSLPDKYIKGSTSKLVLTGHSDTAGGTGGGKDVDLFSSYSKLGEHRDFHTESNTTELFTFGSVIGEKFEISILSVFSFLEAGDSCGLFYPNTNTGPGAIICWLNIKHIYKIKL